MTDHSDHLAERAQHHAEAIMRATGCNLKNYDSITRHAILSAVMDCFEEGYRLGTERGAALVKKEIHNDGND